MLESGKTVENQPQMLDALLGHSVYLFCISDFVMDASAVLEIETGGCPVLTRAVGIFRRARRRICCMTPAPHQIGRDSDMNHVRKECTSRDMAVQMETYVKRDTGIKSQVAREIADFLDKL